MVSEQDALGMHLGPNRTGDALYLDGLEVVQTCELLPPPMRSLQTRLGWRNLFSRRPLSRAWPQGRTAWAAHKAHEGNIQEVFEVQGRLVDTHRPPLCSCMTMLVRRQSRSMPRHPRPLVTLPSMKWLPRAGAVRSRAGSKCTAHAEPLDMCEDGWQGTLWLQGGVVLQLPARTMAYERAATGRASTPPPRGAGVRCPKQCLAGRRWSRGAARMHGQHACGRALASAACWRSLARDVAGWP
eukprot:scaffold179965_cov25-Tisochrysis_lutea.AAC.1